MTWKARGQHIDKHASLENLVYQMNIIQQKGQTFFQVSDYSTGPLLFSYKATVSWLYGWLNHVKSIWYYKQHGKTGINIPIIYMVTRSTFKCVNYLHRSDIYVRLTRTNLQSNSHYQKKKNSFKFYFGNYRLYISFYFISAKRPRKVLWVHTTKRKDKLMI